MKDVFSEKASDCFTIASHFATGLLRPLCSKIQIKIAGTIGCRLHRCESIKKLKVKKSRTKLQLAKTIPLYL